MGNNTLLAGAAPEGTSNLHWHHGAGVLMLGIGWLVIAARSRAELARAMDGLEESYEAEFRVMDTKGQWRWLMSRGTVARRDAQGRPASLIGMDVDITAHREAEEALQSAEAKYTTFYQTLPDPAGITRIADGRYIDVNPAFCELLGFRREEVLGRTSSELQVWANEQERKRLLETYQREGKVDRLPLVAQSKGVQIPGLMSARSVLVNGENCFVFVFHDMTEAQRTSDELRALYHQLQQAGRVARLGAWEDERRRGLVYWSDVCFDIHGLSPNQPPPSDYIDRHVAPQYREALREKFRQSIRSCTEWSMEMEVYHADGHLLWVRASGEPVIENGRVVKVRGVMQDTDEAKPADQRLRRSEERFSRIFHLMPYPMGLSHRTDGRYADINPAWVDMLGIPREEAIGRTAVALGIFTAEDRQRLMEQVSQTGHPSDYEVTLNVRNGPPAHRAAVDARHTAHLGTPFDATWRLNQPSEPVRWVRNLGKIVGFDEHGRPARMLGVAIDVTPQREQEVMLQRLALYDALTGLPNRVLLARKLQECMAQARDTGKQLGVAYLDLDGFKPVNDRLGHGAGDRLLVLVGGRLTRALQPVDTVARLGGDELVILMPGLDSVADCERILGRVMESVSAPYTLDTERVVVTASIGYTIFPQDDADADTLLRHADQAMYAAKQAGRNRFHQFDAAQERAVQLLRAQGHYLREALAQAQFTLYLQPKVDMRSGTVVGAEVLSRWLHPERGLVPPGEFLPLLEGTDLEIGFGEWVAEAALTVLEQLQDRGMPMPLSINIAAQHLQQPGFADWVAGCLARHPRVPAHLVEIEITESAALYDLSAVADTLNAVRAMGVTVALDDFGTGYSSLTYLRRLPMDTLKIDQSFVHGMMGDPGDLAIVQGVIGLARSFGYRVIAEGVETVEQGQMLLQLGCLQAQGYCIARPMPLEDFIGWTPAWQPPAGWQRNRPI